MSQQQNPTIMFIAGEASGDNLGAKVVTELKQRYPKANLIGIGGQAMRQAGQNQQYDAAKIAVVGFLEVLRHYREIKQAWHAVTHIIKTTPPDLLILIDYPGMNLRLAKFAKRYNVKILYYVSPQIWAWHKSRIKQIKAYVDHMAVILPFEKDFYAGHNVPVSYVGSPIVENVQLAGSPQKARQALKLSSEKIIICLAPGSRHSEITRLMPVLANTAQQLASAFNNIELIIPIASTVQPECILAYFEHQTVKPILTTQSHLAIEASDLLICASGTMTLEAAYIGTPMIIIYKTAPLTYFLGRHLVKLTHIGLCNIVAGKGVSPELIQHVANPQNITSQAKAILNNATKNKTMRKDLAAIKQQLGVPGAARHVADLAVELLQPS